MNLRITALLSTCAVVAVLAAASPLSAQESAVDFLAEPAAGSDAKDGYFFVDAEPGQRIEQSVALRNDSDRALRLRLAAVDAVTGPYGGTSFGLPGERPQRTGTWISVERKSVTLAAGASAVVPFAIAVPQDATSGTHLAGIAIWSPAVAEGADDSGEERAGASVHVQTRRVIAVQLNLLGPSDPELVISGVEPATRPDGIYLEIEVANVGRGLTKAKGLIELPDQAFESDFSVDTFVPGTGIRYPVQWRRSAQDGDYEAEVKIHYGRGKVAEWEGTFAIGEQLQQDLVERGIEDDSSRWLWWVLTAIGLLLMVIVALMLFWRRGPTPAAAGTDAFR